MGNRVRKVKGYLVGRKLEIGPGPTPIGGYEHLDIRDISDIEIVADAREIPVEDNTFDEILARNVLEHFYFKETVEVLKEWWRVLKIGGTLEVLAPNIIGIYMQYLNKTNTFDQFVERVYGSQDYPENCHYAAFTKESLRLKLEQAGFNHISCYREDQDGIGFRAVK